MTKSQYQKANIFLLLGIERSGNHNGKFCESNDQAEGSFSYWYKPLRASRKLNYSA